MTGRIERAIDVFLDAINKGTLAKGSCTACAVGNLVAHGLGAKIQPRSFHCNMDNTHWSDFFWSTSVGPVVTFRKMYDPNVIENIEATEFNWKELSRIEHAFESNAKIHADDYQRYSKEKIRADQIKGLEAVIKVMLEFDDQKLDVKEIFTKKADLIPIN